MNQAVTYLRVSTKQQGESGLGLEAQKSAVDGYCQRNDLKIIRQFTEVESGKRADRPQLMAAVAHCNRTGAKLVVAKLDRLSRNVAFLSKLMESQVDFVAVDNATANRLTIHILAAVAEDEAVRISLRTKAALQALKARGVKLGSARDGAWANMEDRRKAGCAAGCVASAISRRKTAMAAIGDLLPKMVQLRNNGESYSAIAAALNLDGATTSRGNPWSAMLVRSAMIRLAV